MKLKVGDRAPDILLPDQEGKPHRLSDEIGKWVLLYFYPKDDTPGCTAEACAIRDNFRKFESENMRVFGISVDSVDSHKKFTDKYDLPFTLLSDSGKTAVKKYGVWSKKKFLGREYMGASRMSFLIDPQGRIAKIYEKVIPEKHAADALRDRTALAADAGRK